MEETEKNVWEDFSKILMEDIKKYGKIDENGNMIIDSGLQKQIIGKIKSNVPSEEQKVKMEFIELISGRVKEWGTASELLRDYILKKLNIYSIKDDLKSEMWVYKEGIYEPNGKSEIKILLRNLLGSFYSQFIFGKVIEKIEPDTFINIDEFFKVRHPNEVPVENGILNIQTLKLTPFTREKIFFNKLPVKYIPGETCPKIESFLKEVLKNKDDLDVFYELAGFGLTKEYSIEKACMMVGEGRNGKGKSIELIKRLVGVNNCCSIPLTSLVPESFSVSELFGKMFNLAGDIGNQDLKDTSMFKGLTGRDLISGKRKFQRDIHFENYAKFIFACNELPMVYDLTKGFWDRWILLEFPYTFVTQEEYDLEINKDNLKIRNPNIINEISTPQEMSGLLNKALEGLKRIKEKKNFSSTKGSEDIKNMWIRKSNSFIAFCYEELEEVSDGAISKKELRKRYAEYCNKNKVGSKSDYAIKKVLQDTYGVVDERRTILNGIYEFFWVGLRFKKK
jgi:putative DNA primase/helicase